MGKLYNTYSIYSVEIFVLSLFMFDGTYIWASTFDFFLLCLGVDKGVAEGRIHVALRREVHDPGRRKKQCEKSVPE